MSEKIYVSMPLVKNLGYVKKDGWVLTKCPKCKEECYKREFPEEYKAIYDVAGYLCTQCMLELRRK